MNATFEARRSIWDDVLTADFHFPQARCFSYLPLSGLDLSSATEFSNMDDDAIKTRRPNDRFWSSDQNFSGIALMTGGIQPPIEGDPAHGVGRKALISNSGRLLV